MQTEIERKAAVALLDDGRKRRYLTRLMEHGQGAAVELETPIQKAYAQGMAELGYVRVSNSARCGFERIQGFFVSITEAGRLFAEAQAETPK